MATRLSYLFRASAPDDELMRAALPESSERARGCARRPSASSTSPQRATWSVTSSRTWSRPRRSTIRRATRRNTPCGRRRSASSCSRKRRVPRPRGLRPCWLWNLARHTHGPLHVREPTLAAYYGMPAVTGEAFQRVPSIRRSASGLDPGRRHGRTHPLEPHEPGDAWRLHRQPADVSRDRAAGHSRCQPPDPYSAPTTRERYSTTQRARDLRRLPLADGSAGLRARKLRRRRPLSSHRKRRDHRRERRGAGHARAATSALARRGSRAPRKRAAPSTRPPATARAPRSSLRRLVDKRRSHGLFPAEVARLRVRADARRRRPDDICNREALTQRFVASGYNVKQMLVAITQTDGFLYLGSQE